jgi:hypothetical protein
MDDLGSNTKDELGPADPLPEHQLDLSSDDERRTYQLRFAWMNGPTRGPITEPNTELKTMNATAYCCVFGSYKSATIPRVTDPPAEDKPPRARATTTEP